MITRINIQGVKNWSKLYNEIGNGKALEEAYERGLAEYLAFLSDRGFYLGDAYKVALSNLFRS